MLPALPLDAAGPYVAGAFLVFVALLLIYVAIMANRLARIDRELVELAELVERQPTAAGSEPAADAGAAASGLATGGRQAAGAVPASTVDEREPVA